MSSIPLPIKAVSQRTGLSPHVIRVWERRYGAVSPSRTGTNRRLYTEDEVERLYLLRRLTEGGHSISSIAALTTEELRALAGKLPTNGHTRHNLDKGPDRHVNQLIESIKEFDSEGLNRTFMEAARELGNQGFLRQVVAPLTHRLGDLWMQGVINAAHEHFATAEINLFLNQIVRSYSPTSGAPLLVVATPAGQIHELGALMAAAEASNQGWRTTYLGSCLPAAEIAGTAVKLHARAVALSIVYPTDDPSLPAELTALRRYLPQHIELIIGGRASGSYFSALDRIGARHVEDLEEFSLELSRIRTEESIVTSN